MKQIVELKYALRLLICTALALTNISFASVSQIPGHHLTINHELIENETINCTTCKKPHCNKEGICEVLCQISKQGNQLEFNINLVKKQIDGLDFLIKDELAAAFKVLCGIESQQEEILAEIAECCSAFNSKLDLCCETLNSKLDTLNVVVQTDFAETFTALADIRSQEVTIESKLDDCCISLNSKVDLLTAIVITDFAGTFTAISDIRSEETTIESKLDLCCVSLNSKSDLLTDIVQEDFAGTFTVLNRILNGEVDPTSQIDVCCTTLQSSINNLTNIVNMGFDDNFMQLNIVIAQGSSISTKLDECCSTLNSKIDLIEDNTGTFTALDAIISQGITTQSIIDGCCSALESQVNGLGEQLAAQSALIAVGFAGTATSLNAIADQELTTQSLLDACCVTINNNIDSLTVLVASDFAGTFSSIAAIPAANFTDTYTLLNTVISQEFTTQSKLDLCCSTLNSKIDSLFTNTLVGVSDLCAHTPITGETTITSAGVYCLANDVNVVGARGIIIAANDVVLDLNGHRVSAPGLSGFQFAAISLLAGVDNVVVRNGLIEATTANRITGVYLFDGSNENVVIEDIRINNCFFGIGHDLSVNLNIKNVIIDLQNVTFGAGITGFNLSGCVVENCYVSSISPNGGYLLGGDSIELNNCIGKNASFDLGSCSNLVVRSCQALACPRAGFSITGTSGISIIDCISSGNTTAFGDGFVLSGNSFLVKGCSALSNEGYGFRSNALISSTIEECNAQSNLGGAGFLLNSSSNNCTLRDCSASNNIPSGFDLSAAGASCVVSQCNATRNSVSGFIGNGGSALTDPIFYLNSSVGHGVSNYVNIISPPSAPKLLFGSAIYGANLQDS